MHHEEAKRLMSWDELKEYLGNAFRPEFCADTAGLVQREFEQFEDPESFYRHSTAYLYDLTAFELSETKRPYLEVVKRYATAGDAILDYGCGIGSDGLLLLEAGYRVSFADFRNPSIDYLKWRLHRRNLDRPVYDIEQDAIPKHHLVYSFDVIEHVPDAKKFLDRLAGLADKVVLNFLEVHLEESSNQNRYGPHNLLDIPELLRYLTERFGLLYHKVFHQISHLVVFDTTGQKRKSSFHDAAGAGFPPEGPTGLEGPARPYLSVVIPTRDRPSILTKCLQALARQTLDPLLYEVIVVDDGSVEEVAGPLEQVSQKLSIRRLTQQKKGPAAARNLGVQNARGEIVVFIGDDIIAFPDMLEAHRQFHKAHPAPQKAMLGYTLWSPEGPVTPFMRYLTGAGGHQFRYSELKDLQAVGYEHVYSSHLSVKRRFLLEQGLFDEAFSYAAYEDSEWGYRLAKRGLEVLFNTGAVAYHLHPTTLEQFCERQFRAGIAAVLFAKKHPELAEKLGVTMACGERSREDFSLTLFKEAVEELEKLNLLRLRPLRYQKQSLVAILQDSLFSLYGQILNVHYRRGIQDGLQRLGPMGKRALCSIIIPVFNKLDYTRQCLEALAKNTGVESYEVIIVDNGSRDGTPEFLKTLEGDVKIITNATNLGFAKACNQGARVAEGEYLVFLNNDTLPQPGWLEELVKLLSSDPTIGIAGSKLIYPGTNLIQHAGKVWTEVASRQTPPAHLYYRLPADAPFVNKTREFQLVTGACLMLRKSDFEAVGGFDEGYRNGWEDDDLCMKIRAGGKRVFYCATSVLYHYEMTTEGRRDHDEANRSRFMAKWGDIIYKDDEKYYLEDGFTPNPTDDGKVLWTHNPEVAQAFQPVSEDRGVSSSSSAASSIFNQSRVVAAAPPNCKPKVLIALLVSAGDVLISTAVVRAIRKRHPDAEITYITSPLHANLLEGNPRLDTVCTLGPDHYSVDAWTEVKRRASRGWDHVYLLQAWPDRGADFERRRRDGHHLVDIYAEFAGVALENPTLELAITEEDRQLVDDLLRDSGISAEDSIIALHGRSGNPQNEWGEENFRALAEKIQARYPQLKMVLLGGPESAAYQWPGVVNLAGKLTFRQSAEVIRRCTLFVGVDSVCSHMTSLFQKDAIVLFGHVPPSLAAPLNAHARVLRGEGNETKNIPVEAVLQRIESVLQSREDFFSIVIVTHNSAKVIEPCLQSIRKHTPEPHEIILVDNASSDDTLAAVKRLPEVRVIWNEWNLGYAKAVNQGIRASRGNLIVLLNPDTRVTPCWLGLLRQHLEEGRAPSATARPVGAVGPLSNYVAGEQKLALHFQERAFDETQVDELAALLRRRKAGEHWETKLLMGFCMMIPRSVFERIGLLDENLFNGGDDLELSLRLRRTGYTLCIATDAFIYHQGQVSYQSLDRAKAEKLTQDSDRALFGKLEHWYGRGNVPSSTELWGCEIFGLLPDGTPRSKYRSLRVALIYDNTLRPDTTGEYCKRALQELCTITHFLPTQLTEIAPGQFDLYLNIDDSLHYELPVHLRPAAWWVIDTHLQYEWDLQKARGFDYVFAAQKDGMQRLKGDGIPNVQWLPLACDPGIHAKVDTPKTYDVAFIGNLFPGERERLVKLLRERFPNSFVGRRYFREMARVYSQAKIVFNRSLRGDLNMRVFEALASGSLLVTDAACGLADLFKDGEHLVTYRDDGELVEKIEYYLAHEEQRERLAAQGMREALRRHTYLLRMRRILDHVFFSGATESEKTRLAHSDRAQKPTSIILLTCNQLEYTRQCVESLLQHTHAPYELIFVDNGSTDGTVPYLRSLPGARVIENRDNRGFAAGCNQGLAAAQGEFLVLLNNDTVVTEGWLEGLLRCLQTHPSVGLVGPMTNYVGGPQLERDVPYRTLEEMHRFAAEYARRNRYRYLPTSKLVGFCLLLRREVMEKIGLFDERFGLGNFEDDDYCLRAQLAGYKLLIAGDVFIHHFGHRTFQGNNIDWKAQMQINLEQFLQKWGDRLLSLEGQRYRIDLGLHPASKKANGEGEALFHQGEIQKALSRFQEALERDPRNAAAHNNLGVALWTLQQASQALEHFCTALELDPDNADALANLVELVASGYELNGQIPRVEDSVMKALRLRPGNALLQSFLGKLYLLEGRSQDAEKCFERALMLRPDLTSARQGLEQIHS